jgi:hypothetical protein
MTDVGKSQEDKKDTKRTKNRHNLNIGQKFEN